MKKINSKLKFCALTLEYPEAGNVIRMWSEWQSVSQLMEIVEFFCPDLEEKEVVDFLEKYGILAMLVVPFTVKNAIDRVEKAILSDLMGEEWGE